MPAFRRLWLFAALLLACLWALPVLAQERRVVVDDPDRLFGDGEAVRAAAERLAAEGVDVVIIAVQDAGPNPAAAERYLGGRLDELGIASGGGALRGDQIVFFLAPRPGYDGLYYVSRFKTQLDPAAERIRAEQMRPQFTRGDFAGGLVAGLDAVRNTLNPPTSPVWIAALTALGLGGAWAVAAPAVRRRRASADALAAARKRMEEARGAAGVVIADLGQRMELAQDKAQYDRVSYSSADAQRIADRQSRSQELFARAQAAFDGAEEAQIATPRPSAADYDRAAAQFREAQRMAEEAGEALAQAEGMRASLDSAGPPATGKTTRL